MIPHSRVIRCEFMENIKDMSRMGSTSSQPVADIGYLIVLTNRPGTKRRELTTAFWCGRGCVEQGSETEWILPRQGKTDGGG